MNGTSYSKEDLKDIYLVTFAPNFVDGTYKDDNTILYSSEKNIDNYNANKNLDKENKGYITKGDAVATVLQRRKEYLYEN